MISDDFKWSQMVSPVTLVDLEITARNACQVGYEAIRDGEMKRCRTIKRKYFKESLLDLTKKKTSSGRTTMRPG